jgi:hypothetical protein
MSQFHENLVSTSTIHLASITKASPLVLLRKLIDGCCNLINHINTLCGQNAETTIYVKACGMCVYTLSYCKRLTELESDRKLAAMEFLEVFLYNINNP